MVVAVALVTDSVYSRKRWIQHVSLIRREYNEHVAKNRISAHRQITKVLNWDSIRLSPVRVCEWHLYKCWKQQYARSKRIFFGFIWASTCFVECTLNPSLFGWHEKKSANENRNKFYRLGFSSAEKSRWTDWTDTVQALSSNHSYVWMGVFLLFLVATLSFRSVTVNASRFCWKVLWRVWHGTGNQAHMAHIDCEWAKQRNASTEIGHTRAMCPNVHDGNIRFRSYTNAGVANASAVQHAVN